MIGLIQKHVKQICSWYQYNGATSVYQIACVAPLAAHRVGNASHQTFEHAAQSRSGSAQNAVHKIVEADANLFPV